MDQEEIKETSQTKSTSTFSNYGHKYFRQTYPSASMKTFQLLQRIFIHVSGNIIEEWYERQRLKTEDFSTPLFHQNFKNVKIDFKNLIPKHLGIEDEEMQAIFKVSQSSIKKNVAEKYAKKAQKLEDSKTEEKAAIMKGKVMKVKTSKLKGKESEDQQDGSQSGEDESDYGEESSEEDEE